MDHAQMMLVAVEGCRNLEIVLAQFRIPLLLVVSYLQPATVHQLAVCDIRAAVCVCAVCVLFQFSVAMFLLFV